VSRQWSFYPSNAKRHQIKACEQHCCFRTINLLAWDCGVAWVTSWWLQGRWPSLHCQYHQALFQT
jgi:hypothetical protein